MQESRPIGLTVLAIVEALLGVFAIFGGTGHLLLRVAGGIVGFNGQDINLGPNGDLLYGYTFTIEGLILRNSTRDLDTEKMELDPCHDN